MSVTQIRYVDGKIVQLGKIYGVIGQTYIGTKNIGSREILWDMWKIYEVDGWPEADGDHDSDTIYMWSDIVAGQDLRSQMAYICR